MSADEVRTQTEQRLGQKARDFAVTDDQWCVVVRRLAFTRDLHELPGVDLSRTFERGGDPVTGADHYREAEKDIALADRVSEGCVDEERYYIARAQVHATLALAAATANTPWEGGEPGPGEYGRVNSLGEQT